MADQHSSVDFSAKVDARRAERAEHGLSPVERQVLTLRRSCEQLARKVAELERWKGKIRGENGIEVAGAEIFSLDPSATGGQRHLKETCVNGAPGLYHYVGSPAYKNGKAEDI